MSKIFDNARWHSPPAPALRIVLPHRCRACCQCFTLGVVLLSFSTHCTSHRCSSNRHLVSGSHPSKLVSIPEALLVVARAFTTCCRGARCELFHHQCTTGSCDLHCDSRRFGFHVGSLGNCLALCPPVQRDRSPCTRSSNTCDGRRCCGN